MYVVLMLNVLYGFTLWSVYIYMYTDRNYCVVIRLNVYAIHYIALNFDSSYDT